MPAQSPLLKVFVLFLVGIILPTGFLVYLGVVSIRSETLLLKKESQERVGKTAQALHEQAETIIRENLSALTPWAGPLVSGSLTTAYLKLDEFKRTHASDVSMLLMLDANGHLVYPVREIRSKTSTPLVPLPLDQRAKLEKAEQTEFKDHDYAAAVAIFQSLQKEVESPRWKAIFLTAQAGSLMKEQQYDAAEARYHEILSRFGQEGDEQGYPVGLVIASQLGDLEQAKGRLDLAATSHVHVLQDLLSGRWDLSWDELQFFVRHMMERVQPLEAHMSAADFGRWQTLKSQWEHLRQSASDAQVFMTSRWPGLKRTLREEDRSDAPYLLFAEPPSHRAVAYVPAYEKRDRTLQYAVIADVDTSPLLQRLAQTINPLATASNLAFRLEMPSGNLLAKSEQEPEGKRWPVRADLAQTFPALRLAIAPVSDLPVERAAARRRQVYFGIVILAAVVILIALYATWYAVTREMEMAQLKARFVASMSHELKTPLSIIGLVGQKLQLGRYESPAEAQEYYTMLGEETSRLKGLIDDVLDFSRLMENRQPYRMEPTDLVPLIQETIERFRHSLKSDRVWLECRCEPAVCVATVDREAMSRVILNLLDNAVKYSPPERTHISLSLKRNNGTALIQVADEGHGIPKEEKDLIFDRFYRGRSASESTGVPGTGLGLSIVQHIVIAHLGQIDLQSTVGKGSIFSIELPMDNTYA